MKISISIAIERDSWNSYPHNELEFVIEDERITIKIKDDSNDRVISMNKAEFVLLLKYLVL